MPVMSEQSQNCPECGSEHTYEMGDNLACSLCGHEWNPADNLIRDSVGNVLTDGDSVVVIQDLKVKGSSRPIKAGTKVNNIRLVQGVGDHDIDCKVDGFGPMQLKSSVVKKV